MEIGMTSVSHADMVTFLLDHSKSIPAGNGHMWADELVDNDDDQISLYYPLDESSLTMREYLKTNLKFYIDENVFHFDAEHFDEIRAIALLISCEYDNGGLPAIVADAFGTGGDDSFDYHSSYIEDMVDLAEFYLKYK